MKVELRRMANDCPQMSFFDIRYRVLALMGHREKAKVPREVTVQGVIFSLIGILFEIYWCH